MEFKRRKYDIYIDHIDYFEVVIVSKVHGNVSVCIEKEDFPIVSKHKWLIREYKGKLYARANLPVRSEKSSISMHRLIMKAPDGMEVDHKDNDGLNNRRSNLRIVTHAQNNANKGVQKSNTTGYKGVFLAGKTGRQKPYWAYIWVNNRRISGGYHKTAKEAAKKYNELALEHHGEFAYLNLINND